MSGEPSLSVVVFAYNEAENVQPVLLELRDWLAGHEPDAEVIFVDDGSTDATYDRAREALQGARHRMVRHAENRGIGAALKSGVRAAAAPWVTFMPADGQIDPSALGDLVQAAAGTGAGVVFSVYDRRDDGFDRKILSWGVRALIRTIHGVNMHSDGPYLFQRSLFVPEEMPSDSFLRLPASPLWVRTIAWKPP